MLKDAIGISFEFPDDYATYFAALFEGISPQKYSWHITNSEILSFNTVSERIDNNFFGSDFYSGNQFVEKIKQRPYLPIHARILASFPNNNIDPDEIMSYSDFCESHCEIILLCSDGYVDIYAKDKQILSSISKSFSLHYNCDVTFITKENDSRIAFIV